MSMVRIEAVNRCYPLARPGWFQPRPLLRALSGVSMIIREGQTMGLVGESGSGKSTLTRCLLGLESVDSGRILYRDVDVASLDAAGRRRHCARMQIVFQDPYASLNPRMTLHDIVAEGMVIHNELGLDARSRTARVVELLDQVGLGRDHLHRYPHELSGGQRQRVGIARALALKPEFLILDEPTSALDVSVQAQVLALLEEIRGRLNLAMLFITHDLRVAAQICDHVAVMSQGRVVEYGAATEVFLRPQHEYTRALFAAAPGRNFAFSSGHA